MQLTTTSAPENETKETMRTEALLSSITSESLLVSYYSLHSIEPFPPSQVPN